MDTPSLPPNLADNRAEFEDLIKDIRPELHRYVTRMVGSAVDGEDVVQEALAKAYNSLEMLTPTSNLRGWLFRIAHNKAIDFLRQFNHYPLERLDEQPVAAEPDMPVEEKELVGVALSVFLKLAPKQRSCVILKDVLGYSLVEISEMLNATVPEIKAALHRGRTRLRELARGVEEAAPELNEREKALLTRYIDRFNAHDFEAVRTMLADEVQLDLIGRVKLRGADMVKDNYFTRYDVWDGYRLALGAVEGQPAILFYEVAAQPKPAYFILLSWQDGRVARIRDYRYVPYVMQETAYSTL